MKTFAFAFHINNIKKKILEIIYAQSNSYLPTLSLILPTLQVHLTI